ncbi:DUF3841 domain-containing protein [Azospirillum sp. TSH64]|uniref:DUF3841 domain-containing protein n=1 Tax=Azospirillum sp. TSH64 TaxID=652740 RepID=UPI0011B28E6F|nr:DUF3841 domain-containing protein [Azospirillum sp. TSH64]
MLKPISRSRLLAVLSADPMAPVRVWSAQHRDALSVARQTGWLSGNHQFAFGRHTDARGPADDPDHPSPYDWMRERLAELMPRFSGDYPVWGWLKRPSTRPSIWGKAAGEATVLVSAIVPRHRILLSDFDDWHAVLNDWYLSRTEAEDNEVEAAGGATPSQRRKSWLRVFETGHPRSPEEMQWRGPGHYVQACIDRVHLSEIVHVYEQVQAPRPHERGVNGPATGCVGAELERIG